MRIKTKYGSKIFAPNSWSWVFDTSKPIPKTLDMREYREVKGKNIDGTSNSIFVKLPKSHIKKDLKKFKSIRKNLNELISDDEKALKR